MFYKILLYRVLLNFIKSIGVKKMNVFELMRKFLATLLLAFVLGAMLPACSSSEEEADSSSQEASGTECDPEGTLQERERCLQQID